MIILNKFNYKILKLLFAILLSFSATAILGFLCCFILFQRPPIEGNETEFFLSKNIHYLNEIVRYMEENKITDIHAQDSQVSQEIEHLKDQEFYKKAVGFLRDNNINDVSTKNAYGERIVTFSLKDRLTFNDREYYYIVYANDSKDIYCIIQEYNGFIKWCMPMQGKWNYCGIQYR